MRSPTAVCCFCFCRKIRLRGPSILRNALRCLTDMSGLETIETIPIAMSSDGALRVSGTRVTLETLIAAFQDGATAEEIAHQYPSLPLGDIYEVIGYFLRHRNQVADYLARRQDASKSVQAENERRFDPEGTRRRLLARRS